MTGPTDLPNRAGPAWPVDLDDVRLRPLEDDDGPLLQELLDDLADHRTPFGDPGAADAVSAFLALPEGYGYDAKLLLGLWRDGGLVGALDCVVGYPTPTEWTVGFLVVADRHRRHGIASAVLTWLQTVAADRGARTVRAVVHAGNHDGEAFARARGYEAGAEPADAAGLLVLSRSVLDAAS